MARGFLMVTRPSEKTNAMMVKSWLLRMPALPMRISPWPYRFEDDVLTADTVELLSIVKIRKAYIVMSVNICWSPVSKPLKSFVPSVCANPQNC
jgi:hypothetical protein